MEIAPVFRFGLGFSLTLLLVGLTVWSFPVLGQVAEVIPAEPSTLVGIGVGGSLVNLLGLAATAGRGWQKLADHGSRLEKLESASGDVPSALARLETLAKGHGERLGEIKVDLTERLDRFEDRCDDRHGPR